MYTVILNNLLQDVAAQSTKGFFVRRSSRVRENNRGINNRIVNELQ